MNKREQREQALRWKLKGERRIKSMLLPWIREVAGTFRFGVTTLQADDKRDLLRILKKFSQVMINDIMGFDTRHYKVLEDMFEEMMTDYRRTVSMNLENMMYVHNLESAASITDTTEKWMRRVNDVAIANGWTVQETRQALINHMRNQMLTVATTEAQFVTESTRTVAVRMINDPLKNSVIQIADLIESGDTNAAVRLSRRVMNLVRQPLSMAQGETLSQFREMTSDRSLLMTPGVQGRIVANMRQRGMSLGKGTKEWSAIGDSLTRETHLDADGQQRQVDEPFNVGGYRLQYPGDASLGAGLETIIDCRCSAVFI